MTDLLGEHRLEMMNEAKECARAGMTEFEMAQHFGVTVNTIRLWKARDVTFQKTCQHFQDAADGRVELSLYDKAVGYSFHSEEIKVVEGEIHRIPIVKHVPPDTTAAIFWLKNRRRLEWRDVHKHEHEAQVNVSMPVEDPRKLAMAILHVLREAQADAAKTIEHKPTEQEQDDDGE